jgi:ectoine hydroxylase-related dioxygenase (phytanoyl-CoA dioxygenase family)
MNPAPALAPTTISPTEIPRISDDFARDGFALVRGVLSSDEVAELRQASDRILDDPELRRRARHGHPCVGARLYEIDPLFARFTVHEAIHGLMEAILGGGFQVCGQNIIRNGPGVAISNFHVDDTVEFPLPEGVPRHDARIRMPVQWLTVQVALSDIDAEEHGPTQFVPGSHYSGRHPNHLDTPAFEGRGPVSVLCRAGDIYLQNNQCWHRGAPNRSDRVRYVLQTQYAQRWTAARFHPPLRPELREAVLRGADARLRQALGEADAYPAA